MSKPLAVIAAVLVFAAVPALASAAPTATHVTTPASPAYVAIDNDVPNSFHVAGTTSGGSGDVDIRCYYGSTSALLVTAVPVANGAFATDIPLGAAALSALGYPHPYCTLRAVPTTTAPAAAPNAQSEWQGPEVGWGELDHFDDGYGEHDYLIGQAQSGAFNDYYSAGSCGLCDTYLFVPGSKAPSNAIWWANGGVFTPRAFNDRSAVTLDGVPAYTAGSAYYNLTGAKLFDNPGVPAVSDSDTVDPVTGDLTIDEHSTYATCAPEPSTYPPTDTSCTSFNAAGVGLDRHIEQTDNGLRVTIVDHWKSLDGKAHDLDAVYEDAVHSENAKIAGHEGRVDFTWTGAGFSSFDTKTEVPVPDHAPATIFVKTDRATPDAGDNLNPFGSVTFSTPPTQLVVLSFGNVAGLNGHWDTRYARTIPASGDVEIAIAYTTDFSLDSVKAKAHQVELDLTPPAAAQDPAPAAAPAADTSVSPPPAAVAPAAAAAPVRCVVPKLRGKSLPKAKRLLKKAHCRLGKVARKPSTRVKAGHVVATRFKPGTRHRAGARIRVTVAKNA